MNRVISSKDREAILGLISNGTSVQEAATTFNINRATIYRWLEGQTDNNGPNLLELAKLKRENRWLKEIVGFLTLEQERGKKNKPRPKPHDLGDT